jgi:polar amino acid transport system substrate-binding protein
MLFHFFKAHVRAWVLACTALCALNAHAAPPLRIAIGEYPPFKLQSEPGGGALTEIVVESLKVRGIDSVIERVPNNRAIVMTMAGNYDASFGWAHNAERDEALLFSSKPIYDYRMVFVQRAGETVDWATLADLGSKRIGVTRGNFYSQPFADLEAQNRLTTDPGNDDLSGLKKLLLKRVDLFPLEASVARFMIDTKLEPSERPQLQVPDKSFWGVPIFFVISKKIPNAQELMNEFDKGYAELQRSKRLDALVRKLRK